MSFYNPTKEDLIDMEFYPYIWKGVTYSYSFENLTYHICKVDGNQYEHGPHWTVGSWHINWYPKSKEDVLVVIAGYRNNPNS